MTPSSMSDVRWEVSAGALLAFGAAWYLDSSGFVTAALPAMAVHEAGHADVLRLTGSRVTRVRLTLSGLVMDYDGCLGRRQMLLTALAGPTLGAAYGAACLQTGSAFLRMSGTASLLLTAVNLLPMLPLDGGRAAACAIGESSAATVSKAVSLLLLAAALCALITLRTPLPLIFAAAGVVWNFR